jgi:ABC-type methionine transport system permease subunit
MTRTGPRRLGFTRLPQRFETSIMIAVIVILIGLVTLIQVGWRD